MNAIGSSRADCQVLIVGAGPTGLVLAADLLARGVDTRIIDKRDSASTQTRALALHARSLEVLDMMGLADRFVATGQIVRHFTFYADARRRLSLDLSRNGTRFGFMLDIPQHETEGLLRARVAELGGAVEQSTELTGIRDDRGVISAQVRDPAGQTRVITAHYVVGCDGAHSQVRRELGLQFRGHPYPQDWLLADVLLNWNRPEDEVHAFFRANGLPLVCFPMREHRWRLVLPFAGDRAAGPPSLAEIQELVNRRAPEPLMVSDPTWLACFQCHRRSTDVYRRGHVLLAGDAVHIHTPVGGQGMNTGITDAHNLGWKLALVVAGRAGDTLLDTYPAERGPVAAQVLSLTHTLVRLGTMTHRAKRQLRDSVIPAAFQIDAFHRRAVRRWTQVSYAYDDSSAVRSPRGVRQGKRGGRLRPGHRTPDLPVRTPGGSASLFTVLRGGRHVLVVTEEDSAGLSAAPELRPYRDLFVVVTCDGKSGWPHAYRNCGVLLVRPDGHVAATGRATCLAAVSGYLGQLSARQGAELPSPPLVS